MPNFPLLPLILQEMPYLDPHTFCQPQGFGTHQVLYAQGLFPHRKTGATEPDTHIPWTMNIMEQQSSGFSLGDQYPNPIVIAPEWGRHVHKTNAKSFNKTSAKSQRGIDFYFKSNGSKDNRGHRKR